MDLNFESETRLKLTPSKRFYKPADRPPPLLFYLFEIQLSKFNSLTSATKCIAYLWPRYKKLCCLCKALLKYKLSTFYLSSIQNSSYRPACFNLQVQKAQLHVFVRPQFVHWSVRGTYTTLWGRRLYKHTSKLFVTPPPTHTSYFVF